MDGHQEILRFIDWYGRDRKIHDLSPSLVEEYAREFSQRGADAQKRLVPVKEFFVFLRKKDWIEINLSVHLRASRSRAELGRGARPLQPTVSPVAPG